MRRVSLTIPGPPQGKQRAQKTIPESEVKRAIQDMLDVYEQHGLLYWTRNNSATVNVGGRYMRTGKKGSPDLIVCAGGMYVGIEVKRRGVKLSPEQIAARQTIRRLGGIYGVAESVDDARRILAEAGVCI